MVASQFNFFLSLYISRDWPNLIKLRPEDAPLSRGRFRVFLSFWSLQPHTHSPFHCSKTHNGRALFALPISSGLNPCAIPTMHPAKLRKVDTSVCLVLPRPTPLVPPTSFF